MIGALVETDAAFVEMVGNGVALKSIATGFAGRGFGRIEDRDPCLASVLDGVSNKRGSALACPITVSMSRQPTQR